MILALYIFIINLVSQKFSNILVVRVAQSSSSGFFAEVIQVTNHTGL